MIAFGLLTDSSSASFPCSVMLLVLSAISPHPKQRLSRSCRMCLVFREVFRRYFGRKNDIHARRLAFSAVHVKGPGRLKNILSNWKSD